MIRFKLRLTPKAGRDAIEGWMEFSGERMLKARVAAIPEDGKANVALIALLAKSLKVPKSAIRIASGDTSRIKTIEIDGDPAILNALGDAP